MINPVDEVEDLGHGITKVRLYSWEGVSLFLQPDIFTELPPEEREDWPSIDLGNYVWRGQRDEFEGLLPGLYRGEAAAHRFLRDREKAHFEQFKYALRGRCNLDLHEANENDVWALGQAHGLHTPLLDWTTSPYVALYFAFEEPRPDSDCLATQDETSPCPFRYLYGLNHPWFRWKAINSDEMRNYKGNPVKVFEFPRPLVHDNPHLISQSGLFTRLRAVQPIEDWIRDNFEEEKWPSEDPVLLIIEIAELHKTCRGDCLKFLDRWNINHLSLFPDIRGAALHRNRWFWRGITGSEIP